MLSLQKAWLVWLYAFIVGKNTIFSPETFKKVTKKGNALAKCENEKQSCRPFQNYSIWTGARGEYFYSYPNGEENGRAKKQWSLLIIGNSEGADCWAMTQTRHSETLRSQSITAATPLSLNVTPWLHSELVAEWSGANEAEHRHKERERGKKERKVRGAN